MLPEVQPNINWWTPPVQTVIHQTVNGKYRIQLERSAVKGVDGFKVEANGDDIALVKADADLLYAYATQKTAPLPAAPEAPKTAGG